MLFGKFKSKTTLLQSQITKAEGGKMRALRVSESSESFRNQIPSVFQPPDE
jgi:hypothetical protein